ncbi:MAG: hypothetical protein AB9866_19050 [Syntrophobacteraceae bacterium]
MNEFRIDDAICETIIDEIVVEIPELELPEYAFIDFIELLKSFLVDKNVYSHAPPVSL